MGASDGVGDPPGEGGNSSRSVLPEGPEDPRRRRRRRKIVPRSLENVILRFARRRAKKSSSSSDPEPPTGGRRTGGLPGKLTQKSRDLWRRVVRRRATPLPPPTTTTVDADDDDEYYRSSEDFCNEDALVTDVQVVDTLYEDAPADLRHLFWTACSRRGEGTKYETSRECWVAMNGVQGGGDGRPAEAALYHRRRRSESLDGDDDDDETAASRAVRVEIVKDLDRIFPGHGYLDSDAMKDAIFSILVSYSLADEEVGYCQGMAYLATVSALYMAPGDAFGLVLEIMGAGGCNLREMYLPGLDRLLAMLADLDAGMSRECPEVKAVLAKCGVQTMLFATPWLLTLYASSFPLCLSCRLVDIILNEKRDAILVKVALSVLKFCGRDLVQCYDTEEVMSYLQTKCFTFTMEQVRAIVGCALAMEDIKDPKGGEGRPVVRVTMDLGEAMRVRLRLAVAGSEE